jgi:hypothetical protein
MSLDYDTYGRRYWSYPLPSPFNWGWNEEQSQKVVSILTFTVLILNNVASNFLISFKGVHVELFQAPPKPPGCDFKQWTDDYSLHSLFVVVG